MCEIHTYEIQSYAGYDPTRTTTLRTMFARDMSRRFNELISVVKQAIIERDVFGMQPTTQQMNPPLPNAFDFPLDMDKVSAFIQWLQEQIDKGLVEVADIPGAINDPSSAWPNKYIYDSYKRGVIRARQEMRKAGMNVPVLDPEGVQAVMGTPFHMDRVGLLFIRTFDELKGISSTMANQISKVLADGMIQGDGPRLIARKLVATINGTNMGELGITDTLGRFIPAKRRAEMLARTEVIRAHHQATINEYSSWGVEGVNVKAEFRTAGDHRVCAECSSLEGSVFSLEEAMGIIPVHPMCRCVCLPQVIE